MTLGQYLKQCRTDRGMTLDECSDAVGMSKSHLHGIEADTSMPSLRIAGELAFVLGADLRRMALLAMRSGVKESA